MKAPIAPVTRSTTPFNATIDRPITLLGVWAHPDDEAYLSSVLMHRVIAAGGRVVLLSATKGELGGTGAADELAGVRANELRAAMSVLGVSDVRFLGYADGGCGEADITVATQSVLEVIEDVGPDLVVTFGPDGITGHLDHIAVSGWTTRAAVAAGCEHLLYATMPDEFARRHEALHERIGIWMDGKPRTVSSPKIALHVVPTPTERRAKAKALRAHASQTSSLIELIGAETFDSWWVDEYFRRPAADELAAFTFRRAASWRVA